MRAKLTQRRRDELAEVLLRDGHINASEQAAQFGVSHETIRKDIIYLENIGLAPRAMAGRSSRRRRRSRVFPKSTSSIRMKSAASPWRRAA